MLQISCAILVLAGLLIYVLLDGFDLGVGNLFFFNKNKKQKDEMMSSLAPVWDGNETWLVYAGGMTWAAFPLVYSIALPAFYIPLTLMLFTLMLRGVSFEFRLKADESQKKIWDFAFFIGSVLTSFIQGAALGAIVDGVKIENNVYAGGPFDFLSFTSVATGIAVAFAYSMLGSAWVIYKTEGETRSFGIKSLKVSSSILFVLFLVCAVYVPLKYPYILELILQKKALWIIIVNAVITLLLMFWLISGNEKCMYKKDSCPILTVFLIISLSILNLVISVWPYVIYPTHTLFDVANINNGSLTVVFWLMLIMLPIILAYTGYVYYTFKGKVSSSNQNNFYE